MSRTIVQEYGPIYGEAVNGTVQGRPNGSVYVPLSNVISISLDEDHRYMRYSGADNLIVCNSSGAASAALMSVATAQDLASNIVVTVYSDAELNTVVASREVAAGLFNIVLASIYNAVSGLTAGDTLYIRSQLMNNGTAVATSDVVEVEFVVP